MRYLVLLAMAWCALIAAAQTTNCTSVKNGDTVTTNCTTPQPIPLPALAVTPPPAATPDTSLMMMAAMAASNRPPSDRQMRKYCKKHHGERWVKRNFNGTVVASGTCPAN